MELAKNSDEKTNTNNDLREMEHLILMAAEQGASDLHIVVGHPPILRIDGELIPISDRDPLSPEKAKSLSLSILNEEQKDRLLREREIDFAFSHREKIRLRVNTYYQKKICWLGSASYPLQYKRHR